MASYWQKLKDPRWQKRRLEILNEAEFACEICGDTESTLHVHHLKYDKGKEPWEYGSEWLACLCESCHEDLHDAKEVLSAATASLPPEAIRRVAGYAFGLSGWTFELFNKGASRAVLRSDGDVTLGVLDAIWNWVTRKPDGSDNPGLHADQFLADEWTLEKRDIWEARQEFMKKERDAKNASHS